MGWHSKRASSFITYAIALFFLFDGVALGLNIWITQRVQEQTIELNLAGRQRMLSQRMVKEFLLIPPTSTTSQRLKELEQTVTLFDRTLNAFRIGGSTINTDNRIVTIDTISHRSYAHIIEESWTLWTPLRAQVFDYIRQPNGDTFVSLNRNLQRDNIQLLEHMNQLALAIETQARHEIRQVRLLQIVALILALLNFLITWLLYRRKVHSLEKERTIIDSLLNDMPSATVFTNSRGQLLNENPRFIELLGISIEEAKRHTIYELIVPDSTHKNLWRLSDIAFNQALLKVERSTAVEQGEHLTIWRIEDVSKEHEHLNALSQLAFEDPLLGLDNRAAFERRLQDIAPTLKRSTLSTLMFIDLDGFKQINDLLGHNKGDEVLKEVGHRLQQACRDRCYIARHGGDEFTLFASHLNNAEEAKTLAIRLVETLSAVYPTQEGNVEVGASIGVVMVKGRPKSFIELIHQADNAMYIAKQKPAYSRVHIVTAAPEPYSASIQAQN